MVVSARLFTGLLIEQCTATAMRPRHGLITDNPWNVLIPDTLWLDLRHMTE